MRISSLLLALVIAGVTFTSCARHTIVADGTRDQILHFGNKDEPSDLDPHTNNAGSTSTILSCLFEGLVNLANDGETILPGAAERWEISADGLTYTFHLRPNVQWSNGDPLTAQDFLGSFLRILDPQLGCEAASSAFPIAGARDFVENRSKDPATVGLRAPDAQTFVITLAHPAPYWLTVISQSPFFPVNLRSLDAASGGRRQRGSTWTRAGQLVSNGPFVLAEWRPNAFVRVTRNPHYWEASRVRLNEVRFYPTDDEGAEERSYRAGQLHVTARLPEPKVATYLHERPQELHLLPILRSNFLAFNVARPPFNDARVRRAFALAIDREQLVHAALGELGTPAPSWVRPGTGGYTPPVTTRLDVKEAQRLLAEAGYPGGVGLPKIEFTLNGNAGRIITIGEVLERMWAQNLGVKVSVLAVEFKVYLTTLREKNYQILLDGWGYGVADARDLLQSGTTGDPNNDSGWSNAAYDQAFVAADQTAVASKRREAFDAMERLIAQEVPYTPLYYSNQGLLIHPDVRGWRDNSLTQIDWRELYLEASH